MTSKGGFWCIAKAELQVHGEACPSGRETPSFRNLVQTVITSNTELLYCFIDPMCFTPVCSEPRLAGCAAFIAGQSESWGMYSCSFTPCPLSAARGVDADGSLESQLLSVRNGKEPLPVRVCVGTKSLSGGHVCFAWSRIS